MNILILGGTGAMGKHLVEILKDTDNQVTVTSRSVQPNSRNVSYVKGNAHDSDFLGRLLQKHYDVIVDFMIYSTEEFGRRCQLLLNSCGQYVYISSSRVYADSQNPITEDTPRLLDVSKDAEYLSTDEYALAKARQEDLLRESGKRNYTIVRPYITYSETRLQLGELEKERWLYRALHGRSIVFSRDIANKTTTLTYGHNVSEGIAALLGQPGALGNAYHITANGSITWNEVLNIY